MKKFLVLLSLFIFIQSCDDVIDQSESNKYGAIKLTFNKPSEELTENINNNRSMSQFADVDAVRITINNSSPVTVSIVGGSASYSKSGLSVGTATIKVELTGAGITKYTQTKSVTIIADQTASTSFNAFTITNQSLSFASSFQSTYDGGDIINLSWTNSHAEQPVNIERWDQVGGVWVKTKTVEEDFVGTSFSWDTRGEASGENVKIRIQSTISNSFIDSQPFQLLATDFLYIYDCDGCETNNFKDLVTLPANAGYIVSGSYSNNNYPLLVRFDIDGNFITAVTSSSTSFTNGYTDLVYKNGYIFAIGGDSEHIFVDKWDASLSSLLARHTYTSNSSYTDHQAFEIISRAYDGTEYLYISKASLYDYYNAWNYGELILYADSMDYVAAYGCPYCGGDDDYQLSIEFSNYTTNAASISIIYSDSGEIEGHFVYSQSISGQSGGGIIKGSQISGFNEPSHGSEENYGVAVNPALFDDGTNFNNVYDYVMITSRDGIVSKGWNNFIENERGEYTYTPFWHNDYFVVPGDSYYNNQYVGSLKFYNSNMSHLPELQIISVGASTFKNVVSSNDGDSLIAAGYATGSTNIAYGAFYMSDFNNRNNKKIQNIKTPFDFSPSSIIFSYEENLLSKKFNEEPLGQ
tara:strand:- start:22657 stop:24564 length:1908 start_codon:yes stop_codon:yes gene_type:complete